MIFVFYLLLHFWVEASSAVEPKGPVFVLEPAHHVDFSNSTGTRLNCVAHGNPSPAIRWTTMDDVVVSNITDILSISRNGSLLFHPFEAKDYRQDVHATTYRCVASNPFGTIVSRDARIRAVVKQVYEVQVYDEFVISGNTAVIKCHIPSFVTEYVSVISWTQKDTSVNFTEVNLGSRYSMMPSGELHILDVSPKRSFMHNYKCRTRNRLTGEIRTSSSTGKLFITEPSGSVPPRIVNSQSNVNAKQGDMIVLPCAAQGYPVPVYNWYTRVNKDRFNPVAMTDRLRIFGGSLVIERVEISDSGVYVCYVNNSIGVESAETTLYVTVPLAAYVQPQQQVVDLGQAAHFECVVTGHPVSSVDWLKDGHLIRFDQRVRLKARDAITLDVVQREDRGMYQCHARNDNENVQGSAELRLGDAKPEIAEGFPGQLVHKGSSVSFGCLASGNPPPKIIWSVDGNQVGDNGRIAISEVVQGNGDVFGRLNITSTETEDGGIYHCIARNLGGSSRTSARLDVYGPPFIRAMTKITMIAKDTMIIVCPYAGYPIDNISWEKDGINLPVNHRQTVHPNGTLVVHQVEQKSDSGTYSCVVRDRGNNGVRKDVQVVVMVPPLLTPFSFQEDHLYEGARTRITCGVTGGDIPIKLRWQKDGHDIGRDLDVIIHDVDEYSNILTIKNVTPQHSGNYTCIASNAAASTNYTASLTVNVPPRWIVEPRDVVTQDGSVVTLNCQAEGSPMPTVTWKKAVGGMPMDYKNIAGYRYHFHENGSLQIFSVSSADEGYYLCQVSNNIGPALSKVIHLKIHIAVRFTEKVRNQTVAKGETAHLYCEASGDPPVRLQWSMDGKVGFMRERPRYKLKEQPQKNGHVSELIISQAEGEDTAEYGCVAINAYGSDTTSIYLLVLEPPESPTNFMIVAHTNRSVQVAWYSTLIKNKPIDKYILQYKLTSDSWESQAKNLTVSSAKKSATVTDMLPANTYQLRVSAVNNVGISSPSGVITVSSPEEAPTGSPQNIKVVMVDSRNLKVIWDAPPKFEWHGNLLGYYVGYKLQGSSDQYVFKTVDIRDQASSSLKSTSVASQPQLLLTNLRKFSEYSVVIQAYNRMGAGPKSEEVRGRTNEDVPEQAPLTIQCSPVWSAQSLQVSWEPPPKASINGNLRGYKVLYSPVDDLADDVKIEVKMTISTKTILHGLAKYTNYTLQVLAFTNAGDGVLSKPVYCRTSADIPGPPAEIKAVATSEDSITVTWKKPLRPNGILTKYTVYMKEYANKDGSAVKYTASPNSDNHYEVNNLKSNRLYEFWVTASTSVGEGPSTRVAKALTTIRVPARIVSLGDHLITPWKEDVKLPCQAVGMSLPKHEWSFFSNRIENKSPDGRIEILANGTLSIASVARSDSGNYTCTVQNLYGSDNATYKLTVLAPPRAPDLYLSSTLNSSITLKWKSTANSGTTTQGYHLFYKPEYGDWQDVTLEKSVDSHTLENLSCGTRYNVYISAFNKIGTGEPSPVLSIPTNGSAPKSPSKEAFLHENTTFVGLNLDTWNNGGCSILYFVVQYKDNDKDWILVSNNVMATKSKFVILDLLPQTTYHLKVTAHNNAGSTTEEYDFTTLTLSGGTVPPEMVRDQQQPSFLAIDYRFIVSVSASIFVIITGVAAICFCFHRQRNRENGEKAEDGGKFANNPKLYMATVTPPGASQAKGNFTMFLSSDNNAKGNRNYVASSPVDNDFTKGEHLREDVCPYATFPITPNHRDSTCLTHVQPYNHRNSMSNYQGLPYSKVQNINSSPQVTISSLQIRKEDYGSPLSESDFSELTTSPLVEPYLQIHESRQNLQSQLEQRVPDLLYHKPESSSTETSPDDGRRRYQKPERTRNHGIKSQQSHREVSDDSQDSNSEGNGYTFGRNAEPTMLYSDGLEFSEAECDRDRRYKYTEELKNKHYERNYRDSEDSTLLVRRFPENPDSGFYSERNVSEEYTIAV